METITVNGEEYIKKSSVAIPVTKVDGMDYVIVRTYSAGVFAGFLKRRDGKEVELVEARRLWFWSGAASLSQLANEGVSKPKDCKFPATVPSVVLTEAIEILPVTEKAKSSIDGVKVWQE